MYQLEEHSQRVIKDLLQGKKIGCLLEDIEKIVEEIYLQFTARDITEVSEGDLSLIDLANVKPILMQGLQLYLFKVREEGYFTYYLYFTGRVANIAALEIIFNISPDYEIEISKIIRISCENMRVVWFFPFWWAWYEVNTTLYRSGKYGNMLSSTGHSRVRKILLA